MAAGSDPLSLRAGDADRERVVGQLRRHHLDGRLDGDELEERLGRAYGARTLGDLSGLVGDLPTLAAVGEPLPPAPPQKAGWIGRRSFGQTHELPVPVPTAYREGLRSIAASMAQYGFRLSERHEEQALVFERDERSFWVYLVCVAFFPFGLLALLVKSAQEVRVDFVNVPGSRSRLLVTGRTSRGVRKALLQLSD